MNTLVDQPAVAANIAETLDKAALVLQQLEDSLTRSGFATGAEAYGGMCQILIGQCMWSLANQLHELEPRFQQVAARARAVHALLAPYTEIMARLMSMTEALNAALASDQVTPDEVSATPLLSASEEQGDVKANAVLRALRAEGGGPLSFTALKAKLGIATQELRRTLEDLASAGVIAHRQASGRHVYTLVQERTQA